MTRTLRALRRRMMAQLFLQSFARWLLMAAAVLVAIAAGKWWLGEREVFSIHSLFAAGVVALLGAIGSALVRRPRLEVVARAIDRAGDTRDRFVTALTFGNAASGLEAAAARECAEFVRGADFRPLVRPRLPRELGWLCAPALALALLAWHVRATAEREDSRRAEAQGAVSDTVRQLEDLARQAEKTAEEAQNEELMKLAEQFKRSAEDLHANASDADEAAKAALRELSSLEEMIRKMQDSAGEATPEEMKELAKTLAENDATKEAAAALEAGRMEEAAKQLEEAGEEGGRTAEEVEKALKEALERLAEKRELSEQMQRLAEQMKQAGAGSEALRQLAQMLRQMQPRQGGKNQPGDGKSTQSLQDLLAALQNMKFGEGPEGQPQGQGAGEGQMPKIVAQSFAQGDGDPLAGGLQMPTGQPGTERDTGTTATPFDDKTGEGAEQGDAQQLAGRLGEGETLQQFLPSAGDASKSQRRYKEIYEAMAPAAEAAVVQENIPLGSRFMIKRYFESIRPRE